MQRSAPAESAVAAAQGASFASVPGAGRSGTNADRLLGPAEKGKGSNLDTFRSELVARFARLPALGPHELAAKVALGEQRVVGSAHQSQILHAGATTSREGPVVVVQLEKAALAAAPAAWTHERALPSVALVDRAQHCARNVAGVHATRTCSCRDAGLARRAGLGEALLQRVFEQPIYRSLEDHRQVS